MLWLCILLPQLPLEALCEDDDARATVVTACEGSARWVVCCSRAAVQASLRPMMNYATALAVQPDLTVLERKPHAEDAALQRLAAWAYQFSAAVVPGEAAASQSRHAGGAALWMEIGASLKLFGGFRRLIERIERELSELGYTYRLGVAPTLEAAVLLARCDIRIAITTRRALYQHIRDLSVAKLGLAPDVVRLMLLAGVRTIGVLLGAPRDGVAKRFGPEVRLLLDRLMGAAADPRPTYQPPAVYEATFEFGFEVVGAEPLLFPLRRMLREFAGFLRARDLAVQDFTLLLMHRNEPATRLRIGLSAPDRDADRFFALVCEQLERIRLPAVSVAMNLSADRFAAPGAAQSDFFNSAALGGEAFAHTLDRLAARLGEEQVHAVKCVADHRPEASWSLAAVNERGPATCFPDRPLWLLPQPRPLQLSSIPNIASGPERIESGWWDGGDSQRDYFIVRTSTGADLWVYRDLNDHNWYLHGFWS